MRHGSQHDTRVAWLRLVLASGLCAIGVQAGGQRTTLQQAMLRSPSTSVINGEATVLAPSTNVAYALQQLAGQAAVIFTGSVTSVAPDSTGGAAVRFIVERGLRGATTGAVYTMRVSAWAGGAERYYPGERALFLLTAPSAAGFSAPVMGERGIVPLTGDLLVGNLDLRWIAADVLRGAAAQQSETVVGNAQLRSATGTFAEPAPQEVSPVNALVLPDVHAIDRDLILDLLRTGAARIATRQTR